MQPVSLTLADPFAKTPRDYRPGVFEDARNENEGELLERAGVMLLRYVQSLDECRLSVVAGMLSERHPFHKQPLSFFQKAADKLAREGRLAQEGDLLMTPTGRVARQMLHRIVLVKSASISKMMALSLVSGVVQKLKDVTTGIVALHGAVTDRNMQSKADLAFNRELAPQLHKLEVTLKKIEQGFLKPGMASVNPGQKAAITRERQDLLRNFR